MASADVIDRCTNTAGVRTAQRNEARTSSNVRQRAKNLMRMRLGRVTIEAGVVTVRDINFRATYFELQGDDFPELHVDAHVAVTGSAE